MPTRYLKPCTLHARLMGGILCCAGITYLQQYPTDTNTALGGLLHMNEISGSIVYEHGIELM